MLERKIFFLVVIVLASYFLFSQNGFTMITNIIGLTKLGIKGNDDIDTQAKNNESMSGGFMDETFGEWEVKQAKQDSNVKSIKEAMESKKGVGVI